MIGDAPASADPPFVSVIVCTRNRADSLRRLLASMTELNVPPALRWEFILIDNGSTDDTHRVAGSFASRLPLRYFEHSVPGLSGVRNRGVMEARGRYICWTDDDTMVDREWLAAYVEAFARHPAASFFGGRIYPELDAETPDWIRRGQHEWPLQSIVVSRDPGDEVIPVLGKGQIPWGANWATLAAAQRAHPCDTGLGYAPGRLRSGDETDVMDRMLRAGAEGWWVPAAKVTHFVPSERLSWRRIFRHYCMLGATEAYVVERSPGRNRLEDRKAAVLSMSRRSIWVRARYHRLRFLWWRAMRRPERAVHALARSGSFHGKMIYWGEDRR